MARCVVDGNFDGTTDEDRSGRSAVDAKSAMKAVARATGTAEQPARRRRYERQLQLRPPNGGRYKFKNKFKNKFKDDCDLWYARLKTTRP
jgi:hypothetical protein